MLPLNDADDKLLIYQLLMTVFAKLFLIIL